MLHIKINSTKVPHDIIMKWQNIVNILSEILVVPSAIITRVNPPEIEVIQSAINSENPYHSGDKVLMAKHYCESVVKSNSKLEINFAPDDKEWANAPEIKYNMVAYLGLPVCWPEGEIFGTICVLDNKKNNFGDKYEKVLKEFKELIESHLSLIILNENLKSAIDEIKSLKGMIPICSYCKNIRDDDGYWNKLEEYISSRSEAEFSHAICPECAKKYYPELDIYDENGNVKI